MRSSEFLYLLADVDDDLILSTQEIPDMKKNPSRTLRIVLIAAAVFVLLAGTVLAATYKFWSPGLASHFGADEAAQEALLDSGRTQLTGGQNATQDNGLRLTLEQVLCDGTQTTLSIRWDSPESGWFTPEKRKWACMFLTPSLTIGEREFKLYNTGFDQDTITDTSAYMIWSFWGDCSDLNGQTAVLTLQAIGNLDEAITLLASDSIVRAQGVSSDPLLLNAPVSLSWTLDIAATPSKALDGSFSGVYNGRTITFEDVVLTPVSVRFTVTQGLELFGNPAEIADALYPTGIVLADGTEIGWTSGGTGSADAVPVDYEPETLSGYYTFDKTVLDLDSIVGITFAAWADTSVDPEVGDVIVFTLPLQ